MTISRSKLLDYFILCARVLLACTFISYGWAKLADGQFGLNEQELAAPVKDTSLFRLSWHLFGQEPFRSFVGVSQIIASLLLLYNRTVLLGALFSIPLLVNILVIDITYVKMPGFYWRLSYYLLLDLLILWHYKERMREAFMHLTSGLSTKFKYPFWCYLLLPVMVIVLELLGLVPRLLTDLILHPAQTLHGLRELPNLLMSVIRKLAE